MKRFFGNIPWKNILLFTLVTALGIGAIVGIGKAVTAEEKTISSMVFERGALDEEGVYVKTNESIVTKDLIECQGLRIEPDFEATGTFQVFYYAKDKTFMCSTQVMNAIDGTYEKGNSIEKDSAYPIELAKYCRIVITPDAPKDDNGYVDEDFEIAFYQVLGFANDFTITVNKKQKAIDTGLLKELHRGYKLVEGGYDEDGSPAEEVATGYSVSTVIDVSDIKTLRLVSTGSSSAYLVFYNDTGETMVVDFDEPALLVQVGSEFTHLQVSYKTDAEIAIYKGR